MIDSNDPWVPWEPNEKEPWDLLRAAHLVRRAGFAVTFQELDALVAQGYERTVDQLFQLGGREDFEIEMAPIEQTIGSQQDPAALASWWLLRMVGSPCQLLEKITFFWHGHFATSADKVADAKAMLAQNRVLRANALGSFETLLQLISRDVAMLTYLDSTENRKTRPNENYARELMELFCLGPGNYTEGDIKELARCFTGWEVRQNRFQFNKHQHDTGIKSLLGRSGHFSGEEAVRIVLEQPAAATFIAGKLVRFFCTDNELDAELLKPLAGKLRENDFAIAPVLRKILTSRYFWSDRSMGQKVRSPVELAIGMIRTLGLSTNMYELRRRLSALGQLPMFPPNVKGWEGGRTWINAATFVERINLVVQMANEAANQSGHRSIARMLVFSAGGQLSQQIDRLVDHFFAVRPPEATLERLVESFRRQSGGTNEQVKELLVALAAIPEFHLI
ncbi:MAG TPA: DUF1800 domain-containing protein [Pirellulaceae bacterium]|nr:DUF1800 domain-containing protein [Pirellulaceae bacterium]HMO91306.1 DUF1800 domain-containing protein [Pirellulaceae bacterium]HMP68510.1 DUF1800 domain-containing protein [Pirellulaceae bacterium]